MQNSSLASRRIKSISMAETDKNIGPNTSTPLITSFFRHRRSLISRRALEKELITEENDDEAERSVRKALNNSLNSNLSSIRDGSHISNVLDVSTTEIENQISKCLKLGAANKINSKNAFQLKLIDFLAYSLKKHDPNMTNLQMASACLDVSGKIYGFRVDKVHSDVLKVAGLHKGEKRDYEDENNNEDINQIRMQNNSEPPKKKKKRNHQILSTCETLRGHLEIYEPLSLLNVPRDAQTADLLFQASLPQHANQGIALNLYNDVIFDKASLRKYNSSMLPVNPVDEFTGQDICPSYAAFKFLDVSSEEPIENSEPEDHGEFHFNLEDSINDNDNFENCIMDCRDISDERFDRLNKNNQVENIVDFQSVIENNPNPNASYEYSYFQQNHRTRWIGPSHWKIIMNRRNKVVNETCKSSARKKKKDLELYFTNDVKEECKMKFVQKKTPNRFSFNAAKQWSEDSLIDPLVINFNFKCFNTYFNKDTEGLLNLNSEEIREPIETEIRNSSLDISNSIYMNGENIDCIDQDERLLSSPIISQNEGGFINDNLVAAPKIIKKIFIPYSQKAKKIDMHQLKKAIKKNLLNDDGIMDATKYLSNLYLNLPENLSKVNIESLTPGLAFVSLLHVAHEKNFVIESQTELSDVTIKTYERKRRHSKTK